MSEPKKTNSRSIGDIGEDYVESIFSRPLGSDFIFRSPTYPTKLGQCELCDVFIALGDVAILIEVKTADREKRPDRTEEQWAEWANTRLQKAVLQLGSGLKAMVDGDIKSFTNKRQGTLTFEPLGPSKLYAIAVIDHPKLDKYGSSPQIKYKEHKTTILTTTHIEIQHLLHELSTVRDLVNYMDARQAFFSKHAMFGVSELDLLAFYKADPEHFYNQVDSVDRLILGEGLWDVYAKNTDRNERDKLNAPSVLVDGIIDTLHESQEADLPYVKELHQKFGMNASPRDGYRLVATELAKLDRLQRRLIGQKLLEKSELCVAESRNRWFAVFSKTESSPTFVFLISKEPREDRAKSMTLAACGAILKSNSPRIVAVSTEPIGYANGFSIDAMYLEADPVRYRDDLAPELVAELESQFANVRAQSESEFPRAPREESA